MRHRIAPLTLALVLAHASACTRVGGAGEEFRPGEAQTHLITPDELADRHIQSRDLTAHIRFLASDARLGRGTPSEGLERSAAWLADAFHGAGLQPAGDDGGFLQYWPYERVTPVADGARLDRTRVRAAAPAEKTTVQVPNVVGRLPAGDPHRDEEYIILVAHYGHLGIGEPNEDGDSIYNGADDNASGVAALVEVAEAFAALPGRTPRPILFIATAGEEHGVPGATWFARNPTVALTDAVAVLNVDMIGRNHPDSIGLVGYGHSSLGPLVEDVAATNPGLGLSVIRDPDPGDDLFQRSDRFAFARRGTPALHFFSGLHEDYHTPDDEAGRIDYGKVTRVARLIFLTAHRLASESVRPEWTEAGRAVIRP